MQLTEFATQTVVQTEAAKPTILSVEDLNKAIRGTLEGQFDLVWVQAEISNFKAHSSGHFYFCLKDSKAQIKAVMFRGFNSRLKFKPQDGLEVIVRGRVTVYEPRGDYQINVELMEPVGAGALQKAFEQLKTKLQGEGLFEATRKRKLPAYPKHIAIVTSPTGAAIRDMLNILSRRNRGVAVTLVPTIVQGATAAGEICKALQTAWQIPGIDLVIVGRGGGSIEDLWAFNDENLARLIARSPMPVISAVGHEIDFTIADFVADLRAPTPSAAAELAVKNIGDLHEKFKRDLRMLILAWNKIQHRFASRAEVLSRRLVDPKKRLQDLILRNDELLERLQLAAHNLVSKKSYQVSLARGRLQVDRRLVEIRGRLGELAGILNTLSPLRTIERGYSVVKKGESIVRSISQIKKGDSIGVQVTDGEITAQIISILPKETPHGL